MKTLTIFQAKDGTRFDFKSKCEKYESVCDDISTLLSQLPERPTGCDFANGSGFVQHGKAFEKVRDGLLEIAANFVDHRWIKESIGGKVHPSYAARIIGEYDNRALSDAWYRVQCTDKELREWGATILY